MHITGKFAGASFNLDGSMHITFTVNEKEKAVEELEGIKDIEKLSIDAVKYRKKRSLDANGYFWQLVDKIAKKLQSDKWTVYLMMIADYGVFSDVSVLETAVPMLQRSFRYTEELQSTELNGKPAKVVRCYAGSSTYDTAEMSDLIAGTVNTAKSLGIETLTPDEQKALIEAWKGSGQYERGY